MPKFVRKASVTSFTEKLLGKHGGTCGVHLDTTLDILEEARFRRRHTDLIRQLASELRFTVDEVEEMVVMYYKFQKEAGNTTGAMTKNQMIEILHNAFDMTDSEVNESVSYMIDKSPSQTISIESWARAMSLFLRGTFEQKLDYCFNFYDLFGTGAIPRDRMLNLMRHSIIGEDDSEDVIKDLYDVIANKLDKDRDGKITYDDYKKVVTDDPLLMEPFAQCLPSRSAVHAIRTTFTHYTGKYF